MARLPPRAGLSLHPQHFQEILETRPDVGWFEIHPEHYLGLGGESHRYLEKVTAEYPLSMNSRALSICSAESINAKHLQDISSLINRYQPAQFSEHLSWCRWQGDYFFQGMPIPYTLESLDQVTINVKEAQNTLGRRILLENPSTFIKLKGNDFSEGEFFSELVRSSGCGLLLDINSLYTSCQNTGRNAYKELESYPLAAVKEVHLGGHSLMPLNDQNMLLINDASCDVIKPVWQLYKEALSLLPMPVATLIEWEHNVPQLQEMIKIAKQAEDIIEEVFPGIINRD